MTPTSQPTSQPTGQPSSIIAHTNDDVLNYFGFSRAQQLEVVKISAISSTIAIAFGIVAFCVLVDQRLSSKKPFSGFQLLVLAVTVLQVFYDFCFEPILLETSFEGALALQVFVYFSLMGVSFLTNVMSLSIAYIVHYKRALDVRPYFWHIMTVVFLLTQIPLLVISGHIREARVIGSDYYKWVDEAEFWLLLWSFIFNVLATGLIIYHVRTMQAFLHRSSTAVVLSTTSSNKPPSSPYSELAKRVALYPVVQLTTRFSFFFALTYRKGQYDNSVISGLYYLHAALAPSASIGYAFCYLYFQPGAATSLAKPFVYVAACCSSSYKSLCFSKEQNKAQAEVDDADATEAQGKQEENVTPSDLLARSSSSSFRNSTRSAYALLSDDELLLECTTARDSFLAMDENVASAAVAAVVRSPLSIERKI